MSGSFHSSSDIGRETESVLDIHHMRPFLVVGDQKAGRGGPGLAAHLSCGHIGSAQGG